MVKLRRAAFGPDTIIRTPAQRGRKKRGGATNATPHGGKETSSGRGGCDGHRRREAGRGVGGTEEKDGHIESPLVANDGGAGIAVGEQRGAPESDVGWGVTTRGSAMEVKVATATRPVNNLEAATAAVVANAAAMRAALGRHGGGGQGQMVAAPTPLAAIEGGGRHRGPGVQPTVS